MPPCPHGTARASRARIRCPGRRLAAAILASLLLGSGPGLAQEHDRVAALGLLWQPERSDPKARAATPAGIVLALHDETGVDPRGWQYGDQILAAGIAVLHLELLDTSQDGTRVTATDDEAAAARARLRLAIEIVAADPRFAGAPMGVLGFGASAQAAALVAAESGPGARIAALALLYPGCATLDAALAAQGGAPPSAVLLQHGAEDQANRPAECRALGQRLGPAPRVRRVEYAGAGFAFDLRPVGADEVRRLPWPGRPGERVAARHWPAGAALAATRTASFFAATLGAPPR